jgi:predicted Zn-dependent protease with MMP-like domain
MNRSQFEQLVGEALDNLPPFFQEKLSNVAVVVEDQAPEEVLSEQGLRHPLDLLGLYHGIPQTRRGLGYNFALPDRISIYQKAIEVRAATPSEIRALVAEVVEHEIGHHFGLSDEELAQAMGEE